MPKRVTYEVRWHASSGRWRIYRANVLVEAKGGPKKSPVISRAARLARLEWEKQGQPTELVVKTKRGKVGKGSSSRRTYGLDRPQSRG